MADLNEEIETLARIAGRIKGAIIVEGEPDPEWGWPGSVAFDMTNRVWYGPKDETTGWGDGFPMTEGPPGPAIELRVYDGWIQWSVVGEDDWTDLIEVSSLVGPEGPAIEMQVSATHIQWRVVGDTAWIDLIALSALKGDQGDQGDAAWSPELATVSDGERRVQQIADWFGGGGPKPPTGKYIGPTGFVDTAAEASNIRGASGDGTGDVIGPGASVDGEIVLYDGSTGTQIKRGLVFGNSNPDWESIVNGADDSGLGWGDGLNFVDGLYRWDGVEVPSLSGVTGWNLSRTGAGTAFTQTGAVQSFSTGVPRITDRGLLQEPAVTTLLLRSQEFNTANWSKSAATVTANAITAPDGTMTADKIVEGSGSVAPQVLQSVPPTAATHTLSFFAKAGERSWLRAFAFQAGLSGASAWFNLATGTVGTVGAGLASASITPAGGGWYRCSITMMTAALAASWYAQVCTSDGGTSYTGDGSSGLYLWGAQLEVGVEATSYIPTTTAAATRGADSASLTVPPDCTEWEAEYGASGSAAGSGLTPGGTFDLTTGRPWIGVGNELKRVRFF